MASLDFEREKIAFKEYYRLNHDAFARAETAFRVLVRSLMAAASDIERPQITSRIKDCEECIGKFMRRYQRDLEENKTAYEIKDYITDLIGVRVTCFYEAELDIIVRHLRENFKVAGVSTNVRPWKRNEIHFGTGSSPGCQAKRTTQILAGIPRNQSIPIRNSGSNDHSTCVERDRSRDFIQEEYPRRFGPAHSCIGGSF